MATTLSATKLCKCLGDDLRLSLVCLMDVQREICVCDLVDALDAPQSTISRHRACPLYPSDAAHERTSAHIRRRRQL